MGPERWTIELRRHVGVGTEKVDLGPGESLRVGIIRECGNCPIPHFDGYLLHETFQSERKAIYWHCVTTWNHEKAIEGMTHAVSTTQLPTQHA